MRPTACHPVNQRSTPLQCADDNHPSNTLINSLWFKCTWEFTTRNWANAHQTRDSISLISYAGCLGLSQVISAKIHSTCASQLKIAKSSLKTHIFEVKGRSRSSTSALPESSSAVLVMIRSKSVSICNHSHAIDEPIVVRWRFLSWVPLFDAIVWGESPHPAAPNYSLEIRNSTLSYGEDPESLSHLGLIRYRVVTDGQTDRQTDRIAIANTRSAVTCRYSCGA